MVLEPGTPVYSTDGEQIGRVSHVLAVDEKDVFDGIIIATDGGHRFIDAPEVSRIGEQGVVTSLDREAAEALPIPSASPTVMRADPAQPPSSALEDKLRRA